MAAQPIESLKCYHIFESSMRVVQENELPVMAGKLLKDKGDSLKQEFICSYYLTLPHPARPPRQYKVVPSSYMMNSTNACGIFHVEAKGDGSSSQYYYTLTFEATQANTDPELGSCNVGLSGPGTVNLMSRASDNEQGTLKYVLNAYGI
jgi:hypothetical protein